MGFIIKFFLWLWQFPQILAAWIWHFFNKGNIIKTFKTDTYTVYSGNFRGGITLGNFIFLSSHYKGDYLALVIAHESGHVKQSKYLGPLYLLVIGLPSILWAAVHKKIAPRKSYYSFYTEKWANYLSNIMINDNGVLAWRE